MQLIRVLSLCLLIILQGMPLPIRADVLPETFVLPDGQAAEAYRVSIEEVLNENYGLKLDTGRRRSSFSWALSDGEIPLGLSVRPTGTIAGVPRAPREEPYHFRVRVIDISVAGSDPLILDFSLKVNAPRIRLSRINAPRLVPTSSASAVVSEADAPGTLDHRPSPSTNSLVRPTTFDFTGRPATPAHATDPSLLSSLPARRLADERAFVPPARLSAEVVDASLPVATVPVMANMPVQAATINCTVCTLKDGQYYIVDASTGDKYFAIVQSGTITQKDKTSFGRGERIPLVIINKNPFLYKYNVKVDVTPVTEEALLPFLKVFSPLFGPVSESAKSTPLSALVGPSLPACPDNKVENAKAALQEIVDSLQELNNLLNAAQRAKLELQKKYTPIEDEYTAAQAHFLNPRATCQELCDAAQKLQTSLGTFPKTELDIFRKSVEAVDAKTNDVVSKINDFLSSYPECQPRLHGLSILREVKTTFIDAVVKNQLTDLQNVVSAVTEAKKAFDQTSANIDRLAKNPGLLQEQVRVLGPFTAPMNVKVTVERKSLQAADGDPFATLAEANLNFGGGPRFALSGGIAYSSLERQEFQTVVGFERNRQGELTNGETLAQVVGLKTDQERRIAPILMLNTRLWDFSPQVGLYFSVGITATRQDNSSDVEYLLGPSLNFLDRKVFITGGVFGGSQQKLAGDLFLGAKLPSGVSAPPTRNEFHWKPGIAITYRILPR